MAVLYYFRLIGFAAGALLTLFLLALIIGHRRPRAFERVLFFLLLALFLFYSGGLLVLNAEIHYRTTPAATLLFGMGLIGIGLIFLPPLLVQAHVEYERAQGAQKYSPSRMGLVVAFYLPLVYFGGVVLPRLAISPSLEALWPGSRPGMLYGLWLGLASLAALIFERREARQAREPDEKRFHRVLGVFFAALGLLILYVYGGGGPHDTLFSEGLATAVMFSALIPAALLGYWVLRHNFLQIGLQRNLVYAVSLAFLALLYLAVVRRVSGWFESILPPEATASVLLFVLVFLFEPLERGIGRALQRTMRKRMDRLQRLTAELQQEARRGELRELIPFAERRISEEFGLSAVRLSVPLNPDQQPLRSPGGLGHRVAIPLTKNHQEIGVLEGVSTGAFLTGETTVALEFLAEQLPATIDLCRLIGEKLRLERELAERERLALLGQMAASISHNLRNPLSSMKTVLQVQLENKNLDESVRQDSALVLSEIERMGSKLEQLLRYARPSLRAATDHQRVDAGALTEQVSSLLSRDAEKRGVKIEFKLPEAEISVRGSEEALSEVLSNLVVNAVEAQPSGGLVRVSLARRDCSLELDILDHGPGISAELREKIFQPFFTTKAKGTGLGLAIVARRLEELGGTIMCESPIQDGRGTRFRVTLPLD